MNKYFQGLCLNEQSRGFISKISIGLSIGVVILLLVSCQQAVIITEVATQEAITQDAITQEAITPTEQIKPTSATLLEEVFHTTLPSGLSIDAYELTGPPDTDTFLFVPVSNYSQEQILAKHQTERVNRFPMNSFFDMGIYFMQTQFENHKVQAHEVYPPRSEAEMNAPGSVSVEISVDDTVVFTADAGKSSPVNPLQGLWSYKQDWFLEYAFVTITYNESENTALSEINGHLVKSGVDLNEVNEYNEVFGFQLINGKPFYFFAMGDQIGFSYDDQITMLEFNNIPHYLCCSASILNPNQSQNMVSFFAQRDTTWYYVELGIFE